MRDGFTLKERRFQLNVRSKLFVVILVRHWNNLPREAADTTFLEVLIANVDGALSNLMYWKVSLNMEGVLE